MTLLLALLAPAHAGVCADDYTDDEFLDDITAAQTALRSNDDYGFINAVNGLQGGLDCLVAELPPRVLAGAYRMIGAQLVLEGNDADGRKWFRTSMELDSTFQWDISEFSQEGTDALVRDAWNAERGVSHDARSIDGSFNLGEGQRLLLDGRELSSPEATPDRFHLLQLVDTDGKITSVWIFDGVSFPSRLIGDVVSDSGGGGGGDGDEDEDSKRSRDKKDRSSRESEEIGSTITVERNRPPLQIPVLVAGGVGLVAGGGFYALSFGANSDFQAATTEEDLQAAASRTNTYVLAAAGLAAAGAGLTTWGVLMDGTPTFGLTWTW